MNSTKLVLHIRRIESQMDSDGQLGRIIEFVERRPRTSSINADVNIAVDGMTQMIQQGRMPFMFREREIPRIVLFLTETDIEALGVKLEVNRAYQITIADQKIAITPTD